MIDRILFRLLMRLRGKRWRSFRSHNYPVCIQKFPGGTEMVLVRNLELHDRSSGWLLPIEAARKEWGDGVIAIMRENCGICGGCK